LGVNDDGALYKWVIFREDRNCRGRCPVTHFLRLVFIDDAFSDLRKPSDLEYLRILSHKYSVPLEFKDKEKYISEILAINVQATINKEQSRKDHIQQLRRMTLYLDIRAPLELPFRENQRVLTDPKFMALLSTEDALYKEIQVTG